LGLLADVWHIGRGGSDGEEIKANLDLSALSD